MAGLGSRIQSDMRSFQRSQGGRPGETMSDTLARVGREVKRKDVLKRFQDEFSSFRVLGDDNFRDFDNQKTGDPFISQRSFDEINSIVDNLDLSNPNSTGTLESLLLNLQAIKEGTDPIFKSRVGTESLFLLAKDQPGRRQTKNIGTQQQLGAVSRPINNTALSNRPRQLK